MVTHITERNTDEGAGDIDGKTIEQENPQGDSHHGQHVDLCEVGHARHQHREQRQGTVSRLREPSLQLSETPLKKVGHQLYEPVTEKQLDENGGGDEGQTPRQPETNSGDGMKHADRKSGEGEERYPGENRRAIQFLGFVMKVLHIHLSVNNRQNGQDQNPDDKENNLLSGESETWKHGLFLGLRVCHPQARILSIQR